MRVSDSCPVGWASTHASCPTSTPGQNWPQGNHGADVEAWLYSVARSSGFTDLVAESWASPLTSTKSEKCFRQSWYILIYRQYKDRPHSLWELDYGVCLMWFSSERQRLAVRQWFLTWLRYEGGCKGKQQERNLRLRKQVLDVDGCGQHFRGLEEAA